MTDLHNLDAEELLQLALRAMSTNDHEKAISLLKQAVETSPEDANPIYLLGAEYAEIGLYDRAKETMAKALELNSGLDAARFQLGLLYATEGDSGGASEVWAAFESYGPGNAFHLFTSGIIALANNDASQAKSLLAKGLELNTVNPALNADMENLLKRIEENEASPNEASEKAEADASDEKSDNISHLFVSKYKNTEH